MTSQDTDGKVRKSNDVWRTELTPEQYRVTRKHGTERPHSSPLNGEKRQGTFHCVCCALPLFHSTSKFESGTGWPSFFEPVAPTAIDEHEDRSLFMRRTETRCARCDAHLGHVFPDGPHPTGLRYCMNGVALDFKPDE
ncbi:MAG: peptide-methionine (R)-S-oxide reductase MsrB [Pseudomonadota bacterium]